MGWNCLGCARSFQGDPDVGLQYAEKGLRMHHECGVELNLSRAHYFLGSIHLDLGDLKNAKKYSEEALRLSRKNGEGDTEGISYILFGRILGKTGRSNLTKAEECIIQGMRILHKLQIRPYFSLGHLFIGELFMSMGEGKKAIVNLKKARRMFREMGMDYWLGLTQELLEGF